MVAVRHPRKMEEEVPGGSDNIVTEFTTYEDFLDSQITSLDLYYLEVRCRLKFESCYWVELSIICLLGGRRMLKIVK